MFFKGRKQSVRLLLIGENQCGLSVLGEHIGKSG